jgi:hypothetical protein
MISSTLQHGGKATLHVFVQVSSHAVAINVLSHLLALCRAAYGRWWMRRSPPEIRWHACWQADGGTALQMSHLLQQNQHHAPYE